MFIVLTLCSLLHAGDCHQDKINLNNPSAPPLTQRACTMIAQRVMAQWMGEHFSSDAYRIKTWTCTDNPETPV